MRVMKGSQINEFIDVNYKNPCYGNMDDKKEYIIDEKDTEHYLVRTALLIELPSGSMTEDLVKYQFLNQADFYDAQFEHESGDYYAWVGRDIKILHDPTKDKPVTKIDKRSKDWRDEILRQNKIAIATNKR